MPFTFVLHCPSSHLSSLSCLYLAYTCWIPVGCLVGSLMLFPGYRSWNCFFVVPALTLLFASFCSSRYHSCFLCSHICFLFEIKQLRKKNLSTLFKPTRTRFAPRNKGIPRLQKRTGKLGYYLDEEDLILHIRIFCITICPPPYP